MTFLQLLENRKHLFEFLKLKCIQDLKFKQSVTFVFLKRNPFFYNNSIPKKWRSKTEPDIHIVQK